MSWSSSLCLVTRHLGILNVRQHSSHRWDSCLFLSNSSYFLSLSHDPCSESSESIWAVVWQTGAARPCGPSPSSCQVATSCYPIWTALLRCLPPCLWCKCCCASVVIFHLVTSFFQDFNLWISCVDDSCCHLFLASWIEVWWWDQLLWILSFIWFATTSLAHLSALSWNSSSILIVVESIVNCGQDFHVKVLINEIVLTRMPVRMRRAGPAGREGAVGIKLRFQPLFWQSPISH